MQTIKKQNKKKQKKKRTIYTIDFNEIYNQFNFCKSKREEVWNQTTSSNDNKNKPSEEKTISTAATHN